MSGNVALCTLICCKVMSCKHVCVYMCLDTTWTHFNCVCIQFVLRNEVLILRLGDASSELASLVPTLPAVGCGGGGACGAALLQQELLGAARVGASGLLVALVQVGVES